MEIMLNLYHSHSYNNLILDSEQKNMKTITPTQVAATDRKWFVVDAKGQTLGRLATIIAVKLSGKNRVDFANHMDNGDNVIVINAGQFVVTGNKMKDKLYHKHTGFLG